MERSIGKGDGDTPRRGLGRGLGVLTPAAGTVSERDLGADPGQKMYLGGPQMGGLAVTGSSAARSAAGAVRGANPNLLLGADAVAAMKSTPSPQRVPQKPLLTNEILSEDEVMDLSVQKLPSVTRAAEEKGVVPNRRTGVIKCSMPTILMHPRWF